MRTKNTTLKTIIVGIGATASVDFFTFILGHFTHKGHGILYVGRWVAYTFKGTFFHDNIIASPVVKNEMLIGWIAHYTIGILFAFSLLLLFGKKWLQTPNFLAAMIIGNLTLFFPLCILQPAMGFGVAFSKLPQAGILLIKIISIHIVYGLGLYFTAVALKKIPFTK